MKETRLLGIPELEEMSLICNGKRDMFTEQLATVHESELC